MKTASLALISALLLPSCLITTNDDDPPPLRVGDGLVVIDWSIDGYQDPDECHQGDVDAIAISIYRSSGSLVGDYEQDCEVFATSIPLAPGRYEADVVLLDPGGYERTTPIAIPRFEIYGDDELTIPVDFPASSFY